MDHGHATDRALGRLAEAGVDGRAILWRAQKLARRLDASLSYGVLMLDLNENVATLDGSNGDQVWAIIRNQHVVTLMLRRSTQPRTTQALNVDRVGRVPAAA